MPTAAQVGESLRMPETGGFRDADAPRRCAAPADPGWVYVTVGRVTPGPRRFGFAGYRLVVSVEDTLLVVRTGWRFVGFGSMPPLVQVLEKQ
jgi:hypothetical protein